MNRCQLVADHNGAFGVKRLCQVIGVARSSFYHWLKTTPDREARAAADEELAVRIRAVHTESAGAYGAPRVTAELREAGEPVNHKRVARVMRKFGITGLRLHRRHKTTIADPSASKAPDLLGRDFTAVTANTRYVGDITYLPIADGTHLYLAAVMDLASRRLAGHDGPDGSPVPVAAVEAARAGRSAADRTGRSRLRLRRGGDWRAPARPRTSPQPPSKPPHAEPAPPESTHHQRHTSYP